MKKGGSAALAAMLRQRTEVIQSGGTPAPPTQLVASQPPQPLSEGERLPKQTHPAAFAVQEAAQQRPAPPAPRAISPSPARAMSPARATNSDGPMLISHPKRNFSPTPARNASPTPVASGRTVSPTPAAPPRSISPLHSTVSPTNANNAIAGLPKTIPFSGANKCFVCDKTVYKMEEIIAVGHVWHDKCFTCGGKTLSDSGCGRVLKRDGYLDHAGEPFCQACYNKLYRPKGFNVGVGMNTDVSSNNNTSANSITGPPAISPANNNKPVPPPPPAPPAAPPAARPTPPAAPPAPTTSTTAATTLGGGSKCSICTKTVYKMEEIVALGRIFHDKCFTCGGVNNSQLSKNNIHGCGKVLKRDTYVDHDNEPYCQACYARLFGPKTFGFGLTGESTVPNGSGNNIAATTSNNNVSPAPPAKAVPAPPAVKPTPPPPVVPLAPGMSSNTGKAIVSIGTTSKADQSGLFKEASYVGDNDEVDESEW